MTMEASTPRFQIPRKPVAVRTAYRQLPQDQGPGTVADPPHQQLHKRKSWGTSVGDRRNSLAASFTNTIDEAFQSSEDFREIRLPPELGSTEPNEDNRPAQSTHHDNFSHNPRPRQMRSIYLRPMFLYAICMSFVLLVVGLVTIYCLSRKQQGFSITLTSNHYAWKFGPTAILVFVVALWRQVVYHCKVNTPWRELYCGEGATSRSLLLDYVSPLEPVALINSIKCRHWSVAASISTFVLLKLVVLFSTGLLVAEQTIMTRSNFAMDLALVGNSSDIDTLSGGGNDGSSAIVTYYGITEKGLDFPEGTNEVAVFQYPLSYEQLPVDSIVQVEVAAFYSQYRCEPAQLTYTNRESLDQNGSVMLQAAECSWSTTLANLGDCTDDGIPCAKREVFDWSGECTGTVFYDRAGYSSGDPFFRFVIGIENNVTLGANTTQTYEDNYNIVDISQTVFLSGAILCRPDYSVTKSILTVDTSLKSFRESMKLSSRLNASGDYLKDYTVAQFAENMNQMILVSESVSAIPSPSLRRGHEKISDSSSDVTANNVIFENFQYPDMNLMMMVASVDSMEAFQNQTLFGASFETVYNGLGAQFVRQYLKFPTRPTTPAEYSWPEQRLHVKDASVWPMCVALLLSLGLAQVVLQGTKSAPGTQHADYLAWQLTVLRQNSGLESMLSKRAALQNRSLRLSLEHDVLVVKKDSSGTASEAQPIDAASDQHWISGTPSEDAVQHWRPFATGWTFAALSLALPLTMIITLEGLQRRSNSLSGIADVHVSKTTGEALAAYLSAAVALLVAALYGSADFTVGIFAPYHSLVRSQNASQNMLFSALGSLPPKVLLRAVKHGQMSVALVMFSSTIGALLTIFTSGLYTIETVPEPRNISARTTDTLDLKWDQSTAANAMALFNLVENYNASYPSGTYDEIAIPFFTLDNADRTTKAIMRSQNQTTLKIQIPVYRASLDCSIIPLNSINVESSPVAGHYDPDQSVQIDMLISMDLPEACRDPNGAFNSTTRIRMTTTQTEVGITGGNTSPLTPDQYSTSIPAYPPGCPSLGFIYGQYPDQMADGHYVQDWNDARLTIFTCKQYVEEIPAAVTFLSPTMTIDVSHPPVLYEDGRRTVSTIQYDLTALVATGYQPPSSSYAPVYSANTSDVTSAIFLAAIYGPGGVPAWELEGLQNRNRLLSATQRVYRRFMAQVMSNEMRTSLSTSEGDVGGKGSLLSATLYDPSRLRLKQNNTSKLVLQIVLSVMLVCFAVSYWIMRDMRRLLYHNPCSIAGSMSLLAGSSLSRLHADTRRLVDADCGPKVPSRGRGMHIDNVSTEQEDSFYREIKSRRFRLGWWQGTNRDGHSKEQSLDDSQGTGDEAAGYLLKRMHAEPRRFGIDVVPDDVEGV